jgi:hypothetical protein
VSGKEERTSQTCHCPTSPKITDDCPTICFLVTLKFWSVFENYHSLKKNWKTNINKKNITAKKSQFPRSSFKKTVSENSSFFKKIEKLIFVFRP